MEEQEKQVSNSPQSESENDNKGQKRATRRRNRKRRSRQKPVEAQAVTTQPEVAEPEAEQRPLTGNAAKQKRRSNQHRPPSQEAATYIGPANGKPTVPTLAPLQPMRLRKIDPMDNSEPIVGCPMLTRTRMGIPFRGGNRVARCSVGWSIHDEDEVLLCMHTPTAAECWKEHPEYLEALVEKLRPIIESELAEQTATDTLSADADIPESTEAEDQPN